MNNVKHNCALCNKHHKTNGICGFHNKMYCPNINGCIDCFTAKKENEAKCGVRERMKEIINDLIPKQVAIPASCTSEAIYKAKQKLKEALLKELSQ
jgi:hypothetical protein